MTPVLDRDRLAAAAARVRQLLLDELRGASHWTGELSTSALSTATACMALHQLRRAGTDDPRLGSLIDRGLDWLIAHQNSDGGWGDTVLSFSNISTTMLAHAVLPACGREVSSPDTLRRSQSYIDAAGGTKAVVARYGKDKTFSVPILTHCALAGLVDWKEIAPLPFELACLPHSFYATLQLPVVSYALPALIAIGQVRHHFAPPWNPLHRRLRDAAVAPSLRVLERIQPENGGFLEAAPLTSFVTMSLAAKGLADHPVARKGREFLIDSVRPDGSWPIDTNLATWVTTLAVNALGDEVPDALKGELIEWLLAQQYTAVHPYTQAAPGGWAWTNLPGGVPDADDTPGAILALLELTKDAPNDERVTVAIGNGVRWLLGLQNRDGGWPTFCRGWGALPFDRSAADITAHCLRALSASALRMKLPSGASRAVARGFDYLARVQRSDGSWLPLWFGNQHAPDDINPVYGTSRVLAAYHATGRTAHSEAVRGRAWLASAQNEDGGWGGVRGVPSTVEETALAVDALQAALDHEKCVENGLSWLLKRVEDGTCGQPSPIGFYFAKLWYFERLYPTLFAAGTLRRAVEIRSREVRR